MHENVPLLIAALFLSAAGARAETPELPAAVEPATGISSATAYQMERLEARMARSLTGRRLVAQARRTARRQWSGAGTALRYLPGAPGMIVVDPIRLRRLTETEAALALAREMARAGIDLPFEASEIDGAAYQMEMGVALELAAIDLDFDRWLRQSYRQMEKRHQAREDVVSWRQSRRGAWKEPPALPAPYGEVDRIAYYLYLFGRDPEEFYWEVKWGFPGDPSSVDLIALEDLLERFSARLGAVKVAERAHYARLDGRRYPSALIRAAQFVLEAGGALRLKEAFASFEAGPTEDLKKKVGSWILKGRLAR